MMNSRTFSVFLTSIFKFLWSFSKFIRSFSLVFQYIFNRFSPARQWLRRVPGEFFFGFSNIFLDLVGKGFWIFFGPLSELLRNFSKLLHQRASGCDSACERHICYFKESKSQRLPCWACEIWTLPSDHTFEFHAKIIYLYLKLCLFFSCRPARTLIRASG